MKQYTKQNNKIELHDGLTLNEQPTTRQGKERKRGEQIAAIDDCREKSPSASAPTVNKRVFVCFSPCRTGREEEMFQNENNFCGIRQCSMIGFEWEFKF